MNEDIIFFPFLNSENEEQENPILPAILDIMPWKNQVLFPGITMPVTIKTASSRLLVKDALDKKISIGIVTMLDKNIEGEPLSDDLYRVGTMADVLQVIDVPNDDSVTVAVVKGIKTFKVDSFFTNNEKLFAQVSDIPANIDIEQNKENDALIASIKDLAVNTFQITLPDSRPVINIIRSIKNPLFLIYFIMSVLDADKTEKQKILEMLNTFEKANTTLDLLTQSYQRATLKQQIQGKAQSAIDKQWREHVLQEQMKTIQQELGGTQVENDVKELQERAEKKQWSDYVKEVFFKELKKLQRMNSMSPDYSIQLSYIENIIDLPWNEYSEDNFDLHHAREILDEDHFGLERVKKRIIEFLAV
jgi:ATP-dependent Lon protease